MTMKNIISMNPTEYGGGGGEEQLSEICIVFLKRAEEKRLRVSESLRN